MTDTAAALLRAIAAHPDEDTPRLVYADHLDESGDDSAAARAEFIRLHVRAARLPKDDPERESVVRRIDQLLCAWDVVWQREMRDGFRALSGYRRGFTHRAAATASAVEGAVADPRLLLVEHLELTVDVSARGLRAVVKQPLFARLTGLVVRGNRPLGLAGARALAEGDYPRLDRLVLERQAIGDAGLRALCESRGFPRLRELDIGHNDVTDDGAEVLLGSRLFARLDRLRLWGNEIGEAMQRRLNANRTVW